nr:hypothetical protein [Pantoea agglomerans]
MQNQQLSDVKGKELVAAGHAFAKAIGMDTPLIEIAKMVSELAARLDCALVRGDELEKQRDALAAENAALKHEVAGEMLRAANDIAYAVFNLADMKVTDLKPGVIESTGPAETALIAERNLRDFAAQLRAGKDGE